LGIALGGATRYTVSAIYFEACGNVVAHPIGV
jgi:hypothetical protein